MTASTSVSGPVATLAASTSGTATTRCCAGSTSESAGARSSRSSDGPAPASRRSCVSWPGSLRRPHRPDPGRGSTGRRVPGAAPPPVADRAPERRLRPQPRRRQLPRRGGRRRHHAHRVRSRRQTRRLARDAVGRPGPTSRSRTGSRRRARTPAARRAVRRTRRVDTVVDAVAAARPVAATRVSASCSSPTTSTRRSHSPTGCSSSRTERSSTRSASTSPVRAIAAHPGSDRSAPTCSARSACTEQPLTTDRKSRMPVRSPLSRLLGVVAVLLVAAITLAGCVSRESDTRSAAPPSTVDSTALSSVTLNVGDQKGGTQALLEASGQLTACPIGSRSPPSPPTPAGEAATAGRIDFAVTGNTPPIFAPPPTPGSRSSAPTPTPHPATRC